MNIEVKNDTVMVLDNNFTVSKRFYDETRELGTDIFPALLPDVEYTLEVLCGPNCWSSLTTGERGSAGMYMAHMVRQGLVPYVFAGKLCQSPKVYNMI